MEGLDAPNSHHDRTDARAGAAVTLDERIAASDLTSDHFAAGLIERISWALADADDAEHR